MPAPFQRLSIDQLAAVLQAFDFRRRITGVHMHHTWRPNHAQWKGHDSVVGMWRFHTQERGFSDIAQHLTIDPEGYVWTGRNWNSAPASMLGHNGTGLAGPFMFETVGDFDQGRDALQGVQRRAVLDVIALVQTKFGLAAETLMFHNQAADKTCPGTSLPYAAFLAELRAHTLTTVEAAASRSRGAARARAALPLADSALADSGFVQRTVQLIASVGSRSATAMSATPLEELNYDAATEAAILGGVGSSRDASGGASRADRSVGLTPEQIDFLRPYVINLRMGQFSDQGLMTTSEADVRMIVHEHLRPAAAAAAAQGQPLRVVLYAHGGLVKESAGLGEALELVPWWRANGVYPIHFIWETGLFESIRDLLTRRPVGAGERGLGDWLADRVSDPLLEATARRLGADKIWGGMKAGAQIASAPGGGARYFLEQLAAWLGGGAGAGAGGAEVQLHAVGHSAGSIFHAHLLHAANGLQLPSIRTLQYMAPAVRTDTFLGLTRPLLGAGHGIDALTVFTMRRNFERADDCAKVYRKSLLYFVSGACEAETSAPLLGLEDSLRGSAELSALFGLGQPGSERAEVVWSTSPTDNGRSATRALHHGDFNNDAPTMNSVLRRLLGLDDAAPLPKPYVAPQSRGPRDPWADGVDWPPEWQEMRAAQRPINIASNMAPVPTVEPFAKVQAEASSGRRRALCVGIDNYPTAPLLGCINDAQMWRETLQGLGFETELLRDPTRNELFGAIERLLTEAAPGDELVLQYAGHGTQVQDIDGDEANGDTPGLDEAFCPLDFADGALLIDDDLGSLIDRVPPTARLTAFMDCCHSGTITRAIGGSAPPASVNAKPRFVRATPALNASHRRWRANNGSTVRSAGDVVHNEVVFSACRSDQVAWESGGHGEFTLRANKVLREIGTQLTAQALNERILAAFGPNPRQSPQLEVPPSRRDDPLFG